MGSRLLRQAEAEAQRSSCTRGLLDTFDFQARRSASRRATPHSRSWRTTPATACGMNLPGTPAPNQAQHATRAPERGFQALLPHSHENRSAGLGALRRVPRVHSHVRPRGSHLEGGLASVEARGQARPAPVSLCCPVPVHRTLEHPRGLAPPGRPRARRAHLVQPQARVHLVRRGGPGTISTTLHSDGGVSR